MRAKKCKAIRKVLYPKDWHPRMTEYKTLSHGKPGGVYVMQYVCQGVRAQYKAAKKIYKRFGALPC